jgi:hypothetical protein
LIALENSLIIKSAIGIIYLPPPITYFAVKYKEENGPQLNAQLFENNLPNPNCLSFENVTANGTIETLPSGLHTFAIFGDDIVILNSAFERLYTLSLTSVETIGSIEQFSVSLIILRIFQFQNCKYPTWQIRKTQNNDMRCGIV